MPLRLALSDVPGTRLTVALAAACALWSVPASAKEPAPLPADATESTDDSHRMGKMTVYGKSADRKKIAGSTYSLGKKELGQMEQDDIHRVVATAPGVYTRDEDGYGLRPNVGMRGVSSERSAKISLLEDGVLMGPAAYSAPAAYFFPQVTRMERVEILKGPATLRYGPNTVGGALHLITRSIPKKQEAFWDLAGGNTRYSKAHIGYGGTTGQWGWLVEGLQLNSDGFKELDGGGNTGFDKTEAMAKLRWQNSSKAKYFHRLLLKATYSREVSNETYTGLTRADFAANPYRRYAATQLDQMNWQAGGATLTHTLDVAKSWRLETTAYHSVMGRAWQKLEGLGGDRTLIDVLSNPTAGNNAYYLQLLRGEASSQSASDRLFLTTNDRNFYSQGLQTRWTKDDVQGLGGSHDLLVSLRLHRDQADRHHTGDWFNMTSGYLKTAGTPTQQLRDAVATTTALAAYVQDEATWQALTVTAGLRVETALAAEKDALEAVNTRDNQWLALLPGLGVQYQVSEQWMAFAGIHRGFIPVAPGQKPDILAETSWNAEAGVRAKGERWTVEAIGFWSHYSNLKGTCTSSSGCDSAQVGDEFNGGETQTVGAELLLGVEPQLGRGWKAPLQLSYTLTHAQFLTSFESENPQWGKVKAGDLLPYLPQHQLALKAGAEHRRFYVSALGRLSTRMQDSAGQAGDNDLTYTDNLALLDLAAGYHIPGGWGTVYASARNLTDSVYVASARPFGLRPEMARLMMLGWKGSL